MAVILSARRDFMVKNKYGILGIMAATVVLIYGISGCQRSADSVAEADSSYDRIRSYIDTLQVINTHEHQIPQASQGDDKVNFYTLLARSYLAADVVSAGAPPLRGEVFENAALEELWATYGRALDFCRGTSYYSHFLEGFRVHYDFREPAFTKEGIARLSQLIEQNYARREDWYAQATAKARFELMFVDQYWDAFNTKLDERYYALVFNINAFFAGISRRSDLIDQEGPAQGNVYKLAEAESVHINTLEEYLDFADRLIQRFREQKVVCFKNSSAYARSLDYADIPYERARSLYERRSSRLSAAEQKELMDFMFHWLIKKSIEADLPIQIHTGYLAGNGNTLENSHPLKLNNLFLKYPKARFVLFHGGYPWVGEYAALGKMFANVHLDIVWLPQISREAAVQGLEEMFDTVPYNKFFWGGDCHFIEESTGSLEFGKDVVAQVLAARVERGLLTEDVAQDMALKIFRENAIRFFKLEERLHRTF
jgi:hypothetical protein